MIKKVLGNAPFDIFCRDVILVPGKTKTLTFSLSNDTEYDLPLRFCLGFSSAVKSDLSSFNVVVPADGNTLKEIKLDIDENDKIFICEHLCQIKINDGVLESESDYEITLLCEMAYKCADNENDFSPTNEVFFTSDGTFFANKGECICLEIPLYEEKSIVLDAVGAEVFLDGEKTNDEEIKLGAGLNKLCIKMNDDGKIELFDKNSMQKIYLNTLNPKYFLED